MQTFAFRVAFKNVAISIKTAAFVVISLAETKNCKKMRKLTTLKLKLFVMVLFACSSLATFAQGWPNQYGGVMLQGFYWDSYSDSQWAVLEKQADELAATFDLIWIPQSGYCGGQSMGYDDLWWFNNYNSSFGTEQQLRSMINTFKSKGLKTLADVVINHRRNVSNWVDFPKETYKGVTYEMKSTDICANDDGGKTKTWATQNGYQLSANNDTGEGWDGMRDLDHKSENVQTIVKAYLDFLKNDLGYAGFRYDMVKGYSASFTGTYNAASQPEFSVGECWDGTATIKNWIEGTKVNGVIQSAAFDFQFRYTVRNAANNGNWSRLAQQNDGNWPLVSNNQDGGKYFRYAVTFTENHDTETRSNAAQDPLKRDTLAANAYLLAMPGTPCVFMKHWMAYPNELKSMIAARKVAGITNTSSYTNLYSSQTYYANNVAGKLIVVVGDTKKVAASATDWTLALSGYHYAYYLSNELDIPWVDLASGNYVGEQEATLSAVTKGSGYLCYQVNDGEPQRASQKATVAIPLGTTTLKVWLSTNPSNVITRTFNVTEKQKFDIPSFCTVAEGEVCAFFEAPLSWTNTISCWAWDDNGNYTGGTWPGASCVNLGTSSRGNAVWKWSWNQQYTGTTPTQPTQIIFNNTEAPQTADLAFENGGYYMQDGLKANVVSVGSVRMDLTGTVPVYYNLQGQRVDKPARGGVYVVKEGKNCRKVIFR